jgi:hypothetical protein
MKVLILTVLLSLVLVSLFLTLFVTSRREGSFGGPERDSLLPFDEDDLSATQATTAKDPR